MRFAACRVDSLLALGAALGARRLCFTLRRVHNASRLALCLIHDPPCLVLSLLRCLLRCLRCLRGNSLRLGLGFFFNALGLRRRVLDLARSIVVIVVVVVVGGGRI